MITKSINIELISVGITVSKLMKFLSNAVLSHSSMLVSVPGGGLAHLLAIVQQY